MKVHLFTYSYESASFRYRGKYFWDYMSDKYNYKVSYYGPVLKDYFRILVLLFQSFFWAKNDHIIIFQKIVYSRIYHRLLYFFLKNDCFKIYDIDNAMFKGNEKVIHLFASSADLVTVGSSYLRDKMVEYNNSTLEITTSPFPAVVKKKQKNNILNVGWVGYFDVHKDNLEKVLFPILLELKFNFVLTIVGVNDESNRNYLRSFFKDKLNITLKIPENINWNDETEIYSLLSLFDVGVMPLIDNDYNRAKSAFKLKQYLECGVPVIASSVGENKNFVLSNKNGFLVNSKNEWIDAFNYFNNLSLKEYSKLINFILDSNMNKSFNLYLMTSKLHRFLEGLLK